MPNPMNIISQIQSFLNLHYEGSKERDDYVDVPYVDDDDYKTHWTYGEQEEIEEQDKDEEEEEEEETPEEPEGEEGEEEPPPEDIELLGKEPEAADEVPPEGATTPGEDPELAGAEAGEEAAPEEAGEEAGAEDPALAGAEAGEEAGAEAGAEAGGEMGGDELAGGDEMGGDMAGGDMGGDMGMGQEEPLSPKEIGRAYELKKIYARLMALEKHLTDVSEPHLVELRKYVTNARDLFDTVTANYESYKEKADDMIISFYQFMVEAYKILKKYYKKQVDEE